MDRIDANGSTFFMQLWIDLCQICLDLSHTRDYTLSEQNVMKMSKKMHHREKEQRQHNVHT